MQGMANHQPLFAYLVIREKNSIIFRIFSPPGARMMTGQGSLYLCACVPVASHKRVVRTRQRMATGIGDGITDQYSPGRADNQQVMQLATHDAAVQFNLVCVLGHGTLRVGRIRPG